MATDNLNDKPGASGAQEVAGDHGTETVNLVEMGSILDQTRGFLRGLEIGFYPRSG
jgi:hypothetical protein